MRFPTKTLATLLVVASCVPAQAAGSGGGSLNVPAVLAGIGAILALGLYLQSTRRRMV